MIPVAIFSGLAVRELMLLALMLADRVSSWSTHSIVTSRPNACRPCVGRTFVQKKMRHCEPIHPTFRLRYLTRRSVNWPQLFNVR